MPYSLRALFRFLLWYKYKRVSSIMQQLSHSHGFVLRGVMYRYVVLGNAGLDYS